MTCIETLVRIDEMIIRRKLRERPPTPTQEYYTMHKISNNIKYFTIPRPVEFGYWFPTLTLDTRRGFSVTFVSTLPVLFIFVYKLER